MSSAIADVEVNWQRPWLYPLQRHSVFNDARLSLTEASTQAGKTTACCIYLFERALEGEPGQRFWWVAPTAGQARDPFERMKMWLNEGAPNEVWSKNETLMEIQVLDRRIEFKSGERPDNLYGPKVHAAVMDEASRIDQDSWAALRSRLTQTRGPIRVIGNVRGRRNWAYQLARKIEQGNDWTCDTCGRSFLEGMHYSKITAWDAVEAGVLHQDEIEDAAMTMSRERFKELYMAEAADDTGNPFGTTHIRDCTVSDISSEPASVWGWDLGYHQDWTVGVALDSRGYVCDFRRWQRDFEDTIQDILDLVGKTPALVDQTTAGGPVVERLKREGGRNFEGYRISNATKKQELMEALKLAIQRGEVRFPEDTRIVEELLHFEYEYTKTKVLYRPMPGHNDDAVDAIALAVYHKEQGRDKQTTVAAPVGFDKQSYWRSVG